MTRSEKQYFEIMLEEMNGKFDFVIEMIHLMNENMKSLAKQEDLEDVKREVQTIKLSLRMTDETVFDHERRLKKLEEATS